MAQDEVVVFVDYQNMIQTGRNLYGGFGATRAAIQLHPEKLARRIVSYRNRLSTLAGVHVFRGSPDPARDPEGARANRLQEARWSRSSLVHVHTTPLVYPEGFPRQPAREEGVDELLAETLLKTVAAGSVGVAVVASHDQDLQPALSAAVNLRRALLEVAAWDASRDRLRLHPGSHRPWCHRLTEDDYREALEPTR